MEYLKRELVELNADRTAPLRHGVNCLGCKFKEGGHTHHPKFDPISGLAFNILLSTVRLQ